MTSENLSIAQREAARAAAMSDLRDIRLFGAELNFDHFPAPDQPLSWSIEMTPTIQYEDGSNFFVLELTYQVDITVASRANEELVEEEQPESEKIASLSFELNGLYSLNVPSGKPPPTLSELDALAKTTGTLALYPYAREFVQSMTSRMGLPPLTLNTLRLPYPDTSESPSVPDDAEPPRPAKRARKPRASLGTKAQGSEAGSS